MDSEVQEKLDQLAKLPKAARLGIMLALCGAVVAGYYFTYYEGAQAELRQLRSDELDLQRKLSEVRSVVANLVAFEEEITGLEAKLSVALRQLPNEKQLEVLLTDISNLGKSSGVEIESFKRENEVVHDFYAEVPISIELEGGYHDIARFFDLMSKLPRIVNMGSLQISYSSKESERAVLKVQGTATTFRFVGKA